MKKWMVAILCLVLLAGCNSSDSSNNKNEENNETTNYIYEEGTLENQIEMVVKSRVNKKYSQTDIDSLTINPDAGTDYENDYVVLVNLIWNVKNHGKQSKEVLEMYSSDLAVTLVSECDNVQELAIFWTVPYLDANAKMAYEKENENMHLVDQIWDKAFDDN